MSKEQAPYETIEMKLIRLSDENKKLLTNNVELAVRAKYLQEELQNLGSELAGAKRANETLQNKNQELWTEKIKFQQELERRDKCGNANERELELQKALTAAHEKLIDKLIDRLFSRSNNDE